MCTLDLTSFNYICIIFYTDVSPLLYIATGIISGQWLLYAGYEMLDHFAIKSHNPTSAQNNSGPQDQSLTCAF